jgi:hypothetical protein
VVVALFIMATGGTGLGLILWWARDMLAARRNATPALASPPPAFHGLGLSPETVVRTDVAGTILVRPTTSVVTMPAPPAVDRPHAAPVEEPRQVQTAR